MTAIGFDTSNYTTSIACFDGVDGVNFSKLLPVKAGQLGLRQSDAVFHHTQSLSELSDRLFSDLPDIGVVGVSTRPRAVEGSYMPCFSVGISHAKMLSQAFRVPLVECSHQQGHVAAALWGAGRMDLMDTAHLAWHLSGGTTELLLIKPDGKSVVCERIGGTTDISAGQLIDRTGQLLGLLFPAGKAIDKLSAGALDTSVFGVKCNESAFSLSGVQNKVQTYFEETKDEAETAAYAMRCVCSAVLRATQQAQKKYPGLEVVFSGGVSSNSMLRRVMSQLDAVFAPAQYSTDNALGVAILAHRAQEG